MDLADHKLQWSMYVGVYHTRQFGHAMYLDHGIVGRPVKEEFLGRWKGAGIPEQEMRSASGLIVACFENHLITRYGIQGEYPDVWAKEVGPF